VFFRSYEQKSQVRNPRRHDRGGNRCSGRAVARLAKRARRAPAATDGIATDRSAAIDSTTACHGSAAK